MAPVTPGLGAPGGASCEPIQGPSQASPLSGIEQTRYMRPRENPDRVP
jgi:hypothetical protein